MDGKPREFDTGEREFTMKERYDGSMEGWVLKRKRLFTFKGIQRRLVVSFLSIGLVPMMVMGTLSYYNSSGIVLNQTNHQMQANAAKELERLETFMGGYRNLMENVELPLTPAIRFTEVGMKIDAGTMETVTNDLLNFKKMYPAIRKIQFFDLKGNEKVSTLQANPSKDRKSVV